jgi:hypothetical protein
MLRAQSINAFYKKFKQRQRRSPLLHGGAGELS